MDGNSSECCLLCGDQLDGNGDVASPNNCSHVFHLICVKNWADIKINTGHPVTCPLQSCLKPFQSIGVKKNSKTMKVVNVIPVDQDWSCPICLNSMSQVNEIGNPEVCNHHFCLSCLLEWSQTNTSCPLDRMEFRIIFVKNAVGGAIQRRVRTPQRDLRAEITDGESEDTEDDVEVTVANAVSNSLVVAANELMRNRMLNAICPQCQLTAGPDAVVCSACNGAYHRHCARVRDTRNDQWRCLRCRSQAPSAAQRGGRQGAVLSPLSRARRNAIVFNEWHDSVLRMLGNTNYHSSDDDTFSCDSERADEDDAVSESVDSITTESDVNLPSLVRGTEERSRPGIRVVSDSDDDDPSDALTDDENSDERVTSDDDVTSDDSNVDVNIVPRQTRQTSARVAPVSRRPPREPAVNPIPLRQDLFSQFSDSDSDISVDSSLHSMSRRQNGSVRPRESDSNSNTSNSDSDGRDGRRSRVSNHRHVQSDHSDFTTSVSSSEDTHAESRDGRDRDDFVEPRPQCISRRRRARWESDDSEEEEERAPKRQRVEAQIPAQSSRPRRLAAPVDLAETSFNVLDESIEDPPPSSTTRRRNAPTSSASSRSTTRSQERIAASSSRGGGSTSVKSNSSRGASSAASRRATAGSSSGSASTSASTNAASRRVTLGSSGSTSASAARPTSSGAASSRRAAAATASRPSSSRGRRSGGGGGSARTSGKRKKKSTKRKKTPASSRKRKSSIKKHKVVRKARKRQKKARRENRQPSITVSTRFPNRTESTEAAPRLSILGEGRFPSGPYDTTIYTPASLEEATVSSSQGNSTEANDPAPAPAPSGRLSDVSSASGFLSGLLESQSRLFTPTKYLRVNASDGSLFAVSRAELHADLISREARRTSSPPTTESPPSANEMRGSVEASTSASASSSPIDPEPPVASSSNAVLLAEAAEEAEAEEKLALTYSPVEEAAQGCSDVEVDSTPLTDISSSTLGGRMYGGSAGQGVVVSSQATSTTEQSGTSSPERSSPATAAAAAAVSRSEELKRSDFATRKEFETAVANIAKRTVGSYYLTRVLSKEEYKAQLKRVVQKVSGSGYSTHKVKNIISLAKKCVDSFIKARSNSGHLKRF